MANTPSARKRVRQSEVRRQLRSRQRSEVRTAVKRVRSVAESKAGSEELTQAYRNAASVLDRMSAKGTIPKMRAARYKSRLNVVVKKASASG